MGFRPRYSLRTLFVVIACISAWLAWEIHRVQARKDLSARVVADGGRIEWADTWRDKWPSQGKPCPQVSWLRRMLGDRAAIAVFFVVLDPLNHENETAELAPVKATFPEADVLPMVNDPKIRLPIGGCAA